MNHIDSSFCTSNNACPLAISDGSAYITSLNLMIANPFNVFQLDLVPDDLLTRWLLF